MPLYDNFKSIIIVNKSVFYGYTLYLYNGHGTLGDISCKIQKVSFSPNAEHKKSGIKISPFNFLENEISKCNIVLTYHATAFRILLALDACYY